jgi:hypothetical protein
MSSWSTTSSAISQAVADGVSAGPLRLGQQRPEPLDPPVDRSVIGLDGPLGEQLLDVVVGQPEVEVPADGDDMMSDWKRKLAKADSGTGAGRGRRVVMPAVSLLERSHSERNSAGGFLT